MSTQTRVITDLTELIPGDLVTLTHPETSVTVTAPFAEWLSDRTVISLRLYFDQPDEVDTFWIHPGAFRFVSATREVPDTTPAPLDPSKKAPEPGDTLVWMNSGIEVRVTELTPAAVVFAWSNGAVGQLPWSEWFNYLQPAPKPEWAPGTSGTASTPIGTDERVMRSTGYGPQGPVWVDSHNNRLHESEVTDFVPDEARPLPTRDDMYEAIALATGLDTVGVVDSVNRAVDAVLALLGGESR